MRVAFALPQYLCIKCATLMYVAMSDEAKELLVLRHLASCWCPNPACGQYQKPVFIRLDLVESA